MERDAVTEERPRRGPPRLAMMRNAFERRQKPAPDLVSVLDRIRARIEDDSTPETLTVGEVVDAIGRRAYGPLLLIIGLFAISPATIIPGMTWLSSALILLIASQMAFGRKQPWLPPQLLRVTVPGSSLVGFMAKIRPRVLRMEEGGWLRTRWPALSSPPLVNVVALAIVAAALVTFPLGLIPLAPLAPGIAIVAFGVGMTARDGVWLLLGLAGFALALWLALPLIF